jgi:hypothetical protein
MLTGWEVNRAVKGREGGARWQDAECYIKQEEKAEEIEEDVAVYRSKKDLCLSPRCSRIHGIGMRV